MSFEEEWKVIEDFPNYEVSNLGRVKSLGRYIPVKAGALRFKKETILKPRNNGKGYLSVQLSIGDGKFKDKYIHRLVGEAFLPNPEDLPEINHIKGIKSLNSVSDLEWCTRLQNIQHSVITGLKVSKSGREQAGYKGDIHAFDSSGNLAMILVGQESMRKAGLYPSHVYNCMNGVYKTHRGYTFKRILIGEEK